MPQQDDHERYRNSLHRDLALKGQHVSLEPLMIDHIDHLNETVLEGELWKLKVTPIPNPEGMKKYIEQAIRRREKERELPFIVRRLSDGKIVGTTRFYNINPANRNLSIGYTWYSASAQRTAINTECKLLMLTHAFEAAGCISVQWHTHHENVRSQQAIMRLGATFEGVLRNHMILPDGRIRHVHCFSMLDEEWQASKSHLQQRLDAYA